MGHKMSYQAFCAESQRSRGMFHEAVQNAITILTFFFSHRRTAGEDNFIRLLSLRERRQPHANQPKAGRMSITIKLLSVVMSYL